MLYGAKQTPLGRGVIDFPVVIIGFGYRARRFGILILRDKKVVLQAHLLPKLPITPVFGSSQSKRSMAGKRSLAAVLVLLLGVVAQAFFGPSGSKSLSRSQQILARPTKKIFHTTLAASSYNNRPLSRTQLSAVEIEDELDVKLNVQKRTMVETFVQKMGGKRTLQRILIANNGMAATKAIMSMRQWAYMTLGDERAIEFVAMATRDDLNANAEFIRLADSYIEVLSCAVALPSPFVCMLHQANVPSLLLSSLLLSSL